MTRHGRIILLVGLCLNANPTTTIAGSAAQWDFNGDGRVNHYELNYLARLYAEGGHSIIGDANGDGRIDPMDVLLFSTAWFDDVSKIAVETREKDSIPKGSPVTGILGLDLQPGSPYFESATGTMVIDPDSDIDTTRTVSVGEEFSTIVRLNGAENLLGYVFDLYINPANCLEVIDIRETRMDIDCNGGQTSFEKEAIQGFYDNHPFPDQAILDDFQYSFNDGTRNTVISPGVWMDRNGNGILDSSEIEDYLEEFQANEDLTDIPFWTEVVSRRPGINESIELFPRLADINTVAGAIDIVGVLLRRQATAAAGFGFDGDAILLEVVFRALSQGSAAITLTNAYGVTETFQDINMDVMPITVMGPSTITVVTGPSGTPTSTLTPTRTVSPTSTSNSNPTSTPIATPVPSITTTPTSKIPDDPTSTFTPTQTQSSSRTPVPSESPTQTSTPSLTRTQEPSFTLTPTHTLFPSPTETPQPTSSPTRTPTWTPTNSPSETTIPYEPNPQGLIELLQGEEKLQGMKLFEFASRWKR